MSIGGIGGSGSAAAMQSTRNANSLAGVGSAAFSTLVGAGSAAAGAFAGPASAAAVSSLRGLNLGGSASGGIDSAIGSINAANASNLVAASAQAQAASGFGGNANSGGDISQATGDINASNKSNLSAAASENAQAQSFQVDMFRLQNAINTQSQTNNLISNMQKARHDAAMATIQNTR